MGRGFMKNRKQEEAALLSVKKTVDRQKKGYTK